MDQVFDLTVNGVRREITVDPDTSLLSVLRDELNLYGSRFGCGLGLCGACSVLLDGTAVPSCDTPVWSVAGRDVVTVEGLAAGDTLHPVQQALIDDQAAQCGYCISGVLISAAGLFATNPHPDEDAVIAALDRNLCRCGSQQRIVRSLVRAGSAGGGPT